MLVHTVCFWLRTDLTAAERTAFLTALEALKGVPSIKAFYLGRPAPIPPRPVVDLTFDYSITCVFEDVAGHDAYQVHPTHKAFVAVGKPLWSRVQIYDAC